MDGWTDKWMGEWMGEWMDGWNKNVSLSWTRLKVERLLLDSLFTISQSSVVIIIIIIIIIIIVIAIIIIMTLNAYIYFSEIILDSRTDRLESRQIAAEVMQRFGSVNPTFPIQ